MRAFGFLILIVAIFILINAINLREVLKGRLKFNLVTPDVTTTTTDGRTVVTNNTGRGVGGSF